MDVCLSPSLLRSLNFNSGLYCSNCDKGSEKKFFSFGCWWARTFLRCPTPPPPVFFSSLPSDFPIAGESVYFRLCPVKIIFSPPPESISCVPVKVLAFFPHFFPLIFRFLEVAWRLGPLFIETSLECSSLTSLLS